MRGVGFLGVGLLGSSEHLSNSSTTYMVSDTVDRTFLQPLFSTHTRQTTSGQPITLSSLVSSWQQPAENASGQQYEDTQTPPSWSPGSPLAPRALWAPVTCSGKELTSHRCSVGSSSFCWSETCHFLTAFARFLAGGNRSLLNLPISHFPSFSSFPARDSPKLSTTLLLFFQPFSFCFILPEIREG